MQNTSMKNNIRQLLIVKSLLFVFLIAGASCKTDKDSIPGVPVEPKGGYKFSQTVSWGDEFDNNGTPDAAKWRLDNGNGYQGWGNLEQQYFTPRPENIKIEGGQLKITAKREAYEGFDYTSGKIVSPTRFKYGRIAIRAKMPLGIGLWPAFFMFGEKHKTYDLSSWPACGEIDIMEIKGNMENKVHYHVHTSGQQPGKEATVNTKLTDFNEYRIDWTPNSIKWFFNGAEMYRYDRGNSGADKWPFDDYFNLIMCINIGGNFVGPNVNQQALPAQMEIDYVRYYELENFNKAAPVSKVLVKPEVRPSSATISEGQSQTFSVANQPPNTTVHWYALGAKLEAFGLKGNQITVTPELLRAGGVTKGNFTFYVDFRDKDGNFSEAAECQLKVQ